MRNTHTLSLSLFPFLCFSVHVECLPGSIKGTGRQHSPTSKPFPLAVFSHTIYTHTNTHKHMCMQSHRRTCKLIKEPEEAEAEMDVGMRWTEVSDGLAEDTEVRMGAGYRGARWMRQQQHTQPEYVNTHNTHILKIKFKSVSFPKPFISPFPRIASKLWCLFFFLCGEKRM